MITLGGEKLTTTMNAAATIRIVRLGEKLSSVFALTINRQKDTITIYLCFISILIEFERRNQRKVGLKLKKIEYRQKRFIG